MIYDSINAVVLDEIPREARTLLDLGCGAAGMGAMLQETRGCAVTGVTFSEEEAVIARTRIERVEVQNLNTFDPASLGTFDCVFCCHVLEHLFQPEDVLRRVRACLKPGGTLVVALPNVLFWWQRGQFLLGRFRYTDGWLLDRTHYRFYDWKTAAELLTGTGYTIDHAFADGGIPYTRPLGKPIRKVLDRVALRLFPGLFGWQFVFRCHVSPPPAI